MNNFFIRSIVFRDFLLELFVAVIGVILVVLFVILAIFLVALVLLQNGEGEGLGGLFAGSSNSAFGSRSASVLTKVTYACVGLFFVISFFLALVNKTPSDRGFQEEVQMRRATETRENWWTDAQPGAVIEEADEGEQDDGIARPDEADAAIQDSEKATLPEEPGVDVPNIEVDAIEDADAALRPD